MAIWLFDRIDGLYGLNMIDGPTKSLPYADQLIDCEMAMEAVFHDVHDALVRDGLSDREAADRLLAGVNEPQIAVLVMDAVEVGWPNDLVRRAVLGLAGHNMARVATSPRSCAASYSSARRRVQTSIHPAA
ncbi:MAG: hypothetical protein ED558_16510 [Oricola sp.]|nr:MAG: hypothetical protein ED558_16510 [Oricola sp.]